MDVLRDDALADLRSLFENFLSAHCHSYELIRLAMSVIFGILLISSFLIRSRKATPSTAISIPIVCCVTNNAERNAWFNIFSTVIKAWKIIYYRETDCIKLFISPIVSFQELAHDHPDYSSDKYLEFATSITFLKPLVWLFKCYLTRVWTTKPYLLKTIIHHNIFILLPAGK